ncbi:MAG: hypothetical protein RLZZ502_1590, partial [Pseudomonadota bacterium]
MTQASHLSRRRFILSTAIVASGIGGGCSFQFTFPGKALLDKTIPEVNAWVVIKLDDTVVIRIARTEMGQGTLTGLAQLVAEELECDWRKVTTEYPTPAQNLARQNVWKDMSTGGSRGIRQSHDYVRQGGAAAREMLISAAAQQWGVPAAECTAANSLITHRKSGKVLSYGQVAEAAAKIPPPKEIKLKDPKDWKIAGKPLARLDTRDKINGKKIYAADLKLPGMLNAAIRACPVFGGVRQSMDASAARQMPGVRHVFEIADNAVAVVADTWWQAHSALQEVKIVWDNKGNDKISSATIRASLQEGLGAYEAHIGNQNGNIAHSLAEAKHTIEATYSYPYQNHACMEPMNATVVWTAERCEAWIPTQNAQAAHAALASAAGLKQDQCDV